MLRYCLSPRFSLGLVFTALLLGICSFLAHASVTVTSPKPQAILYGKVQVVATTGQYISFGYAMLYVDSSGRSISNTLPLRFSLDTTRLTNGTHFLRVDVFDATGRLATSSPVRITVVNPTIDARYLPRPAARQEVAETPQPTLTASAAPGWPALLGPADAATATFAPTTPDALALPIGEIRVLLDGRPVLMIAPPVLQDGRILMLLRPVVELAGGSLAWDRASGTGTITLDQREITLALNDSTAYVDGKPVALDQPVTLLEGRVYVPATAWRVLLGGGVGYDPDYRCVLLRSHASLVRARLAK